MKYGLIEGFYGPPWPWGARRGLAPFLADHGYGFYIYAPKNDRSLRQQWRSDWPATELRELEATAGAYRGAGMAWGVGLSPHEAWREPVSAVGPALEAKAGRLMDLGLDLLAVLFDDMRGDTDRLAERQAEIVWRLSEGARPAHLLVCPTYYSDDPLLDQLFGRRPDGYLEELGRLLASDVDMFWTGPSVLSADYCPAHMHDVAGRMGRQPFLWDNYPVNDVSRIDHLHLGAFGQTSPELTELIAGHAVNPMLQAELSRIPLATLADRYRLGHGYDPETSFRAALAAECDQDLATRLAIDAPLFQEQGRRGLTSEQLERLSAGYSALPGAMAAEVVAWLAVTGTGHL